MKFSPTNIIRIISSRHSPANNSQERNKKETVDNLIRVYPKNKKKKRKTEPIYRPRGRRRYFSARNGGVSSLPFPTRVPCPSSNSAVGEKMIESISRIYRGFRGIEAQFLPQRGYRNSLASTVREERQREGERERQRKRKSGGSRNRRARASSLSSSRA